MYFYYIERIKKPIENDCIFGHKVNLYVKKEKLNIVNLIKYFCNKNASHFTFKRRNM